MNIKKYIGSLGRLEKIMYSILLILLLLILINFKSYTGGIQEAIDSYRAVFK